jgi:hypothetical protein
VIARWSNRALLTTWDAWREVTSEEARRQWVLARALQRLQNAAAGAALGSWRALVDANVAARKEDARKDRLLQRVVLQMARGSLGRALQRWAASVLELRALEEQVSDFVRELHVPATSATVACMVSIFVLLLLLLVHSCGMLHLLQARAARVLSSCCWLVPRVVV